MCICRNSIVSKLSLLAESSSGHYSYWPTFVILISLYSSPSSIVISLINNEGTRVGGSITGCSQMFLFGTWFHYHQNSEALISPPVRWQQAVQSGWPGVTWFSSDVLGATGIATATASDRLLCGANTQTRDLCLARESRRTAFHVHASYVCFGACGTESTSPEGSQEKKEPQNPPKTVLGLGEGPEHFVFQRQHTLRCLKIHQQECKEGRQRLGEVLAGH